MFDEVFDNLRKATEATLQVQQELFKKWATQWPGPSPAQPGWTDQIQKFQKKWTEFVAELLKKQRETLDAQFSAGLKRIEEAFHVAEAKDPEELRTRTIELWQKSFECLRQTYEAQVRDFQAAITKWTELITKGAA